MSTTIQNNNFMVSQNNDDGNMNYGDQNDENGGDTENLRSDFHNNRVGMESPSFYTPNPNRDKNFIASS